MPRKARIWGGNARSSSKPSVLRDLCAQSHKCSSESCSAVVQQDQTQGGSFMLQGVRSDLYCSDKASSPFNFLFKKLNNERLHLKDAPPTVSTGEALAVGTKAVMMSPGILLKCRPCQHHLGAPAPTAMSRGSLGSGLLECPQSVLLFQLARMKILSLGTQEENKELWMQR